MRPTGKRFFRQKFFMSLGSRLIANRHISFFCDPSDLGKTHPIKVVFIKNASLRDPLMRVWGKENLVFVRCRKDGVFPPGAISIVARLTNARFLFLDGDDLQAVIKSKPELRAQSRLIMRSPLDMFADHDALLGLRIQNCDGDPDSELIEMPISTTEISMWLKYPAPQRVSENQKPDAICYLEHPSVEPMSRAKIDAAIAQNYPDITILHNVRCCGIDDPNSIGPLLDMALKQHVVMVTRDATCAAYLSHLGHKTAVLRSDGRIAPCTLRTSDGMALLDHLTASGLYDLSQKRGIRLVEFLSHYRGNFKQHSVLLRKINKIIANHEGKLQLFALAQARRFDPSLTTDLGNHCEALVAHLKNQSLQRYHAMRRLTDRFLALGIIATCTTKLTPELEATQFEFSQKETVIEQPTLRRMQTIKASLNKRLKTFGIRGFAYLGRKDMLWLVSTLVSKKVAQLGIERGFQFLVGMSGSSAKARSMAQNIERSLKDHDAANTIICARLYLSAGATDDGLRVLKRCTKLSNAHQATVLSCLHRTSHIKEGLAWFEAFPDTLKYDPKIAAPVVNLLLNGKGRKEAFNYLAQCVAENGDVPLGVRALFGRLAVVVGNYQLGFDHLAQVVEADNENPDVLQKWAQAMRMTGQIQTAIADLQGVRYSGFSRALLLLSYLHAEQGDLMAAISTALAAFRLNPSSSALTTNVVILASSCGADQLILDVLLKHGATSPDAKITAAMHLVSRRDYPAAHLLLDEAKKGGAEPLRQAQTEARLLLHEEKFDSAAKILKQALAIDPTRLNLILMAAEVADRQKNTALTIKYMDHASLISSNDYRVLESQSRRLEGEFEYIQAEAIASRSEGARRANSLRDDLRNNWRLFRLRAGLDDKIGAERSFSNMVSGLHQLLPGDIPAWKGGSLAGKSVLLLSRGGPGDEIRNLQVAGRALLEMGAKVSFLGDNRMRDIFHQNFPEGEFFSNPLAGSKLRGQEISQINLPHVQAGTVEIARRLGLYIRAKTLDRFDQTLYADEIVLHSILPKIFANEQPQHAPLIIDATHHARAKEILAGLEGDGPIVTISWRGSYFSPNRPSEAYLQIPELGPLVRTSGVRFIDSHPNTSKEERDEIFERFGVRLLRPEGLHFRDDLALLGALMCNVDANIVPPVTQRDLAAGVGAPNIWSFDVIPGMSEAWRVDKKNQTDLWQPKIDHHSIRHHQTREAVVNALAKRVAGLS